MAGQRWGDLSPGVRRAIVTGAAIEGALKLAALIDIRRRPAEQIRGGKKRWMLALTLNSAGLIPVAYFRWGRHRPT